MAAIINGNAIAETIRNELKQTVDEMKATLGVTPGLAVVLVGDRMDSATYVRNKKKVFLNNLCYFMHMIVIILTIRLVLMLESIPLVLTILQM